MVKRTTLCLVTALATLAVAGPSVASGTSVHCSGGEDDPYAVSIGGGVYLSLRDGSRWAEDNEESSLQRTNLVCYETDEFGKVLRQWIERPADKKLL